MNRILMMKPPRIALLCLLLAVGIHAGSPPGTVLHFPFVFLGTVLVPGGFGIMMWAWLLFRKRGTAVCPTDPASVLIQDGPYRYSRNPMYLGILMMLAGAAFFLGSLPAFLAPAAFYVTVEEVFIPHEERSLDAMFGAAYSEYRARVGRWIG